MSLLRYYPVPPSSVHPADREAWRAWLEEHHAREKNVWPVKFKKTANRPRLEYAEAVEEAFCFGWIDSTARLLDDERSMIYFARRKPGSGCSRSNKLRIERPLGQTPLDLTDALAAIPDAVRHFEAFPRTAKGAILEWISNAKRPETRARRVAEAARLEHENTRARQPARRPSV